ncbi:exopolysaccharide biosynthesis protein [Paracoccus siganidrum]|uniref:Exopolysaccharide biosynthesis protein n=1 Tax=Paracoccus siganidrum TaxID=1276757 RepID=A0A419AC23_9RHOB|nr:exopolysaccharide biosynthesis protein [Paracoccus siganidrum]RJL21531.1 exopolysaccharide biosynthesis protein [Paracoccus siganidrum]RMC30930.1 exopolysaccharide biosynthesis protein [Paracoccus siganidrum]
MNDPGPGRSRPDVPADAGVTSVLDRIHDCAAGPETRMRDVVAALGKASFIPNLMLPALAIVSPLSGIPLFSSTCGIWIALVSAQMMLQRDHIWLPDFLMRRSISSKRLRSVAAQLRTPAGWVDGLSRRRLTVLLHPPFRWIAQLICLIAGLCMPFLELLPFASSILGTVVFLMSLAMLAHDGLFVLVAIMVLAAAPALVFWLLPA